MGSLLRDVLLRLDVYKFSPRRLARARRLASNSKNSRARIARRLDICEATFRRWCVRFVIEIARDKHLAKQQNSLAKKLRKFAQKPGMTKRRLRRILGFKGYRPLDHLSERAHVDISRMPFDRPKQRKLCKGCGEEYARARGYGTKCFERRRRAGKINNGRKCPKCRRYCYGTFPACFRHLAKNSRGCVVRKVKVKKVK